MRGSSVKGSGACSTVKFLGKIESLQWIEMRWTFCRWVSECVMVYESPPPPPQKKKNIFPSFCSLGVATHFDLTAEVWIVFQNYLRIRHIFKSLWCHQFVGAAVMASSCHRFLCMFDAKSSALNFSRSIMPTMCRRKTCMGLLKVNSCGVCTVVLQNALEILLSKFGGKAAVRVFHSNCLRNGSGAEVLFKDIKSLARLRISRHCNIIVISLILSLSIWIHSVVVKEAVFSFSMHVNRE